MSAITRNVDIVMLMSSELNESILEAALEGFQIQLATVQSQIAFVKAQLGGTKPSMPTGKRTRMVSEEGRRRMAEAQKRRWAKVHAAKGK